MIQLKGILTAVCSTALLASPVLQAAEDTNSSGHKIYTDIAYSVQKNSLFRQVIDTKLNIFSFEECTLIPSQNLKLYEGHIIESCAPISDEWLPHHELAAEFFNREASKRFKSEIKKVNAMDDGYEYLAKGLIGLGLYFGHIGKNPHKPGLGNRIAAMSKGTFGGIMWFSIGVGLINAGVSWNEPLPSVETNYKKFLSELDKREGGSMEAKLPNANQFDVAIFYRLLIRSATDTLEDIGIVPGV